MINSNIKLQINECARIMNEMIMNEDAIDICDSIAIIMNACAIMIHNDIYIIDSIHDIDINELNDAFDSMRIFDLNRFI